MSDLTPRFAIQQPGAKFARYLPKSLRLSSLATIAASVYCLLALSSFLLSDSGDTRIAEPVSADAAALPQGAVVDYADIANWSLFAPPGDAALAATAEQQATTENGVTESLPATPLPLTLLGTWVFSAQEHNRYAIIQSATDSPRRYRIGDDIGDGAQLQAVELRRVIIRRGAVSEYLAFPPNPVTLSVND
ncbi:MAG: hypothetical protein KGZ80_10510 [Methylomonas sp.]|nr:hypothetical protein [Methylomonas sp.]PPD24896.1 MAG: hypothetical protein CTY22_10245 [Methylomonas sp.]PPD33892.1 MAG: hypothetical protein CTY21_10225 [Methylomonas sp.]PPD41459.1 MAG: hypothetical protein CTY17_04000 [Methylomonas sp.]PPD52293.1 MAG: hypothetical protein CTY11_09340 [Methylomonas sp.]